MFCFKGYGGGGRGGYGGGGFGGGGFGGGGFGGGGFGGGKSSEDSVKYSILTYIYFFRTRR